MSSAIDSGVRVYMDKRDITEWVIGMNWSMDENSIPLSCAIRFGAYHSVIPNAAWDIYGSYDPAANPRAEILIRNGYLPVDQREMIVLKRGEVPAYQVSIYSRIYPVTRRSPRHTIVMVPQSGPLALASAKEALRQHEGVVGMVSYWTGVRDSRIAMQRLGRAAGIRVSYRIPRYPMQSLIISPGETYWDAMKAIVDPLRPYVRYDDRTNTLELNDLAAGRMGAGRTMDLSSEAIETMQVFPSTAPRPGRVIVRVKRWR